MQTAKPLDVLIVDDSALVRQILTTVLVEAGGMTARAAADPLIAMQFMKQARPDVIICDLVMPRMDGMTFLRKVMAEDPIPVVICSELAAQGTQTALQALAEGAVEVIGKPKLGVRNFIEDSATLLVDTVCAAARSRVQRRLPARALPPASFAEAAVAATRNMAADGGLKRVVAIGASTGGTDAIQVLLELLPATAPGMVIVQHMPEMFTAAFAQRLNRTCAMEVKEAVAGDQVRQGRVLIAPGNHHMQLRGNHPNYTVAVTGGPLVSRHRPSVDVLFYSVARVAGAKAVGVILTGMGNDGTEGLLEMKRAGATTIAQDEASCTVFGMPKDAIARGAVDTVAPLDRIPILLMRKAMQT